MGSKLDEKPEHWTNQKTIKSTGGAYVPTTMRHDEVNPGSVEWDVSPWGPRKCEPCRNATLTRDKNGNSSPLRILPKGTPTDTDRKVGEEPHGILPIPVTLRDRLPSVFKLGFGLKRLLKEKSHQKLISKVDDDIRNRERFIKDQMKLKEARKGSSEKSVTSNKKKTDRDDDTIGSHPQKYQKHKGKSNGPKKEKLTIRRWNCQIRPTSHPRKGTEKTRTVPRITIFSRRWPKGEVINEWW